MKAGDKVKRLRIYISSTDKYEHNPLYELIVYKAREKKLSGVTVFKGIMGYGASSEIHSNKLFEISEKIPLVVEIIDEAEKIDLFIDFLTPYFNIAGKGYLITADDTTVLALKTGVAR